MTDGSNEAGRKTMPIQGGNTHSRGGCEQGVVPTAVYMAAYEVYSAVYGPQQAMIEGGCRGGFGKGELVALLYARAFPRSEWRARVDEAFEGMDI
jgi:hypothetical protein